MAREYNESGQNTVIRYLDEEGHILKIVPNLRPWIGLSLCPGARAALELAAGEANRLGLRKGMRLKRVEG